MLSNPRADRYRELCFLRSQIVRQRCHVKVTQEGNRVVVTKAGFTCAAWVEVDGVAVPLYGLTDTPEGPEVRILSQERRVSLINSPWCYEHV